MENLRQQFLGKRQTQIYTWIGTLMHLYSENEKAAKEKHSAKCQNMHYIRRHKAFNKFPVKDRTKFEHRHNIVYFSHCPNVTCNKTYAGETDRKIKECIIDHNKVAKVYIY